MLYTILFVPKYYIISSERMRVNPKGQYTIHVLFYFVQLFYIYVFAAIHTASEMYSHVFLYKLQPPCLAAMHFILCFIVKAIHTYVLHILCTPGSDWNQPQIIIPQGSHLPWGSTTIKKYLDTYGRVCQKMFLSKICLVVYLLTKM